MGWTPGEEQHLHLGDGYGRSALGCVTMHVFTFLCRADCLGQDAQPLAHMPLVTHQHFLSSACNVAKYIWKTLK